MEEEEEEENAPNDDSKGKENIDPQVAGPSGSVPLEGIEDPRTKKRYLTSSGSSTGASRKGPRKKVQTSPFEGIPKKKEMSAKAKGKSAKGTNQINHL